MTTSFTWSARLTDVAGNAAAGAAMEVEIFDLAANAWVSLSKAASGSDGTVRGRGEIGDDTVPFAPALRLTEAGAVMATTPAIARTARGVNVDFGEVRRAPVAIPFTRTIGRGATPFNIGGVAAAAATVDLSALRTEVSRDFTDRLALREREVAERDVRLTDMQRSLADRDATLTDVQRGLADRDAKLVDTQRLIMDREARLADTQRLVSDREAKLTDAQRLVADRDTKLAENIRGLGEKDAEIRRLSGLMVAKDQEITTLRQARPPQGPVDVAAIRAEATRDLVTKMAVLDRDLADRNAKISLNEARLADSVRELDFKQAELDRIRSSLAERERISEQARPLPAEAISVTKVTDFATTIGVQLDDAQAALQTRGFSLGAIQINAKTLLRDKGVGMEFPNAEAMRTLRPEMLSEVRFDFRPDKATPEVTGQTVPDLMFLTESRARAVLTSLGLLLEASIGAAQLNPRAASGQAMMQTPTAGTRLPRGGRVHVIFAAAKE
jgi:hypothetical protein